MNNEESAQLMNDPQFRASVKVAVLRYALRILGEAGHGAAVANWALLTTQTPDQTAATIAPATVMHSAVQNAGGLPPDGDLQFAVEETVQRIV